MYIIRSFRDIKTWKEYKGVYLDGNRSGMEVIDISDDCINFGKYYVDNLEVTLYDTEKDIYKDISLRELLNLFSKICSQDDVKLTFEYVKGYNCSYRFSTRYRSNVDKTDRFKNLDYIQDLYLKAESFKASSAGLKAIAKAKLLGYDIDGDGAYNCVPTCWLKGEDLVLPSDGSYVSQDRCKDYSLFANWDSEDIKRVKRVVIPKGYPINDDSFDGLSYIVEELSVKTNSKVLIIQESDCFIGDKYTDSTKILGNFYCTGRLRISNYIRSLTGYRIFYEDKSNQDVRFYADNGTLVILIYERGIASLLNAFIVKHDKGKAIVNHFDVNDPYIRGILEDYDNL